MSRGLKVSALAVAASAIVGLSAVPAQAAEGVYLFQHEYYDGGNAFFSECNDDAYFSDDSLNNGYSLDNRTSSVINDSSTALELNQYSWYRGEFHTLNAWDDDTYLGWFNDKASSLDWWYC